VHEEIVQTTAKTWKRFWG